MKSDSVASCQFFTPGDACRLALEAYYAATCELAPPPGEAWMIDGDPYASASDFADAFHGQLQARLGLLALDRLAEFHVVGTSWDVYALAGEIAPQKMAPIISIRATENARIDAEFLGANLHRLPAADNAPHNRKERGAGNED